MLRPTTRLNPLDEPVGLVVVLVEDALGAAVVVVWWLWMWWARGDLNPHILSDTGT
jgi:hypothetical protein